MEARAEDVEKFSNLEHQTIHLKISEFSKTDSQTVPIFHHDTEDAKGFSLYLFHNGRNQETKGCVSMQLFDFFKGPGRNVGVCLISIKDASNSFKFPRSFSFDNKGRCSSNPLVTMDYIARSVLLKNAEEFLPDDTLTLQIDIYFEKTVQNLRAGDLMILPDSESWFPGLLENDHYLKLDSKLGKRLCEESEYFKRIAKDPLTDKASKRIKLTEIEHVIFHIYIKNILFAVRNVFFDSIISIIDTYVVADKYAITSISETCLLFLKLCLSDFDRDVLKELADDCERMDCHKLAECLRKNLEEIKSEKFFECPDDIEWRYDNRHGDLVFFKKDKGKHFDEYTVKELADEHERFLMGSRKAIEYFLKKTEDGEIERVGIDYNKLLERVQNQKLWDNLKISYGEVEKEIEEDEGGGAKMKRTCINCDEDNHLCVEINSECVKSVNEEDNEFDFFIYS